MYCTRKVNEDITWVGVSDRRLHLFENVYPIARGASFNSYVILDEKTCLMDTVDYASGRQFFENVAYVLGGYEDTGRTVTLSPRSFLLVKHV